MSGGRPKGAISAFKNPANIAALHMQTLEARWLKHNVRHQRYVPAKVKRQLAELAIKRGSPVMKRPTVEEVLRAYRRMGRAKLVRLMRNTNGG
jgi:hypothetical protein